MMYVQFKQSLCNLPINIAICSKQREDCADNLDDGPRLAQPPLDVTQGVTAELPRLGEGANVNVVIVTIVTIVIIVIIVTIIFRPSHSLQTCSRVQGRHRRQGVQVAGQRG